MGNRVVPRVVPRIPVAMVGCVGSIGAGTIMSGICVGMIVSEMNVG